MKDIEQKSKKQRELVKEIGILCGTIYLSLASKIGQR